MKKIFIILNILLFISCKNENHNDYSEESETSIISNKKYFIVMEIAVENQRTKYINERIIPITSNKTPQEQIEYYVSDVEEISSENPISEDTKYKMLDNFEKNLLNNLNFEAIVVDRNFYIYNTYAEASQNR